MPRQAPCGANPRLPEGTLVQETSVSDIKLFRVGPKGAEEIPGRSVAVEKSLQELIERHLDSFLSVRFLAS
jgi:hypothetical protein